MTWTPPVPRTDLLWCAVDLDGTIAEGVWTPDSSGREIGNPIWRNIRKVDRLRHRGMKVVIHTSRGWEHYEAIESWLNHHGIPYNSIVCGKLLAASYVDDRAVNAELESYTPGTHALIPWAAGLFDGEGCIFAVHGKHRQYGYYYMQLAMTDRDVVDKFHQVMGLGKVRVRHSPVGYKTMYSWDLRVVSEVIIALEMLLPYLGERRSAKAREALASLANVKPPKVAEHGTTSRYTSAKWKCRCLECIEAWRVYHQDKKRRERQVSATL